MPERIYLDRRPGSQRIHIELTDQEVTELLDLLGGGLSVGLSEVGFRLRGILWGAAGTFAADRGERSQD